VVAAGVGWSWRESNRDAAGIGALGKGIVKRRGLRVSGSKALDRRPGQVGDVVLVQAGEGAVALTAATGALSELFKHGHAHRDCARIGRR